MRLELEMEDYADFDSVDCNVPMSFRIKHRLICIKWYLKYLIYSKKNNAKNKIKRILHKLFGIYFFDELHTGIISENDADDTTHYIACEYCIASGIRRNYRYMYSTRKPIILDEFLVEENKQNELVTKCVEKQKKVYGSNKVYRNEVK